ncbi:MAG: hypothetical protein IPK03_10920 [Bacteroidetes bacterium]|nr:hypothetical protein [Bacteroidota bacterium]
MNTGRHIAILLVLIFTESSAQNNISQQLIKSFNKRDTILYNQTLCEWSKVKAWSEDTLSKNAFLQDINSVLKLLYSQENFNLINKSQWGKSINFNSKEKYILFSTSSLIVKQTKSTLLFDTLFYFRNLRDKLHDSLGKSAVYREMRYNYFASVSIDHVDTLKNPTPQIYWSNKITLYKTESIDNALYDFFYSKRLKKINGRTIIQTQILKKKELTNRPLFTITFLH